MSKIEKLTIGRKRFDLLKELNAFKSDIQEKAKSSDYEKNVFLMMKFRRDNELLSEFIISTLSDNGLNCVRADMIEWSITGDSVTNPLAVLYCCKYGIALFDEPEEGQNFSPNVAYELGIMHYQHKPCLILINKTIVTAKPFDIVGKIHYSYSERLEVKGHIEKWLKKIKANGDNGNEKIEEIAVALVKKGKSFLLTKRKEKEGDLLWAFPAKRLKPKSHEETALVKECYDETNVNISIVRLIGQREITRNGKRLLLKYWLCSYRSGAIKPKDTDELEEVKWVRGKDAINLISSDLYLPIKKILTAQ